MFRVRTLLLVMLLAAIPTFAQARIWHDRQGNHLTGEFVRVHNGRIVLKRTGGAVVTVEFSQLVEADQDFLRQELESKDQGHLLPPREPAVDPSLPAAAVGTPPGAANPIPPVAPVPSGRNRSRPLSGMAERMRAQNEAARARIAESQQRVADMQKRMAEDRQRISSMPEPVRLQTVWQCSNCKAEFQSHPGTCPHCSPRKPAPPPPATIASGLNGMPNPQNAAANFQTNGEPQTAYRFRTRSVVKLGIFVLALVGAGIGALFKR